MSLINKALKEATEARAKNSAPVALPPLMPVDCPPHAGHGSSLALAALIAVVMTLSAFMTWKWFHADKADLVVRARSAPAAATPVTTPATTAQPVAAAPSEPTLATASKEAEAPSAPANATVASTNSVSQEQKAAETPAPTPAPAPVEPPKPPPVVFILQGILFQPGHSTAVINGKTVSAGEHVGDSRVASIDKETVVLVSPSGETNLLELP